MSFRKYTDKPKGKCLSCRKSIYLFIANNGVYISRKDYPRKFCNHTCEAKYKKKHGFFRKKKQKVFNYTKAINTDFPLHKEFYRSLEKREAHMRKVMRASI